MKQNLNNQEFYYKFIAIILFILLITYKITTINQFPIDKRTDASGFANGHISEIFKSWYDFNYYPVIEDVGIKINNKLSQDEKKFTLDTSIRSHIGASIIQGDFLRVFYVMPNYLAYNDVSPKLMNKLIAVFSLIIFNFAGLIKKRFIFTITTSFLIVLSDFFIYENFFNENIFGLPISLFLICYSLLNLIHNKTFITQSLFIIVLAIFISLAVNIRTEFSFLIFSTIIIVFFNNKIKNFLIYIVIFLIIFFLSNRFINNYFIDMIQTTNIKIELAGGVSYSGPIRSKHTLMHPLWMGLGDNEYGKKLGFKWEDNVARQRVAELRPDIYKKEDLCGSRVCLYHDDYQIYPRYAEYMEGYQQTLKLDIVEKFKEDPKVFILIYIEKIFNQIKYLSSVHLNPNYTCIDCEKNKNIKKIKSFFLKDLPTSKNDYINKNLMFSGYNIFLVSLLSLSFLIFFLAKKNGLSNFIKFNYDNFIFLISSLPLAISAIIISNLGATFNSIFHFSLFSILLVSIVNYNKLIK